RQRRIHIVAAKQDVIADRDTLEHNFTGLFLHRDETEIRRAATDIDDQDDVAYMNLFPPVGVSSDPGVEGRLRLFEQNHLWIAGVGCCFESKLAGDGVEGCRYSNENLMRVERLVRALRIPGIL